MHFNLDEELKKAIGANSPDIIKPLEMATHPLAWRMRIKFDTKLPPHELFTKDIRFHNPEWGDAGKFKAPIESLEIFLPVKWKILMTGFELYNFFIEAMGDMSNKNKANIEAFWFCGKYPIKPKVKTWTVGKGKVLINEYSYGKEYYGTASRGWRAGTPRKNVIADLLRID